jgi:alkyl sulfatase BDS1-like metallo-beta-lactamase superfamily hydrolase
MIEAVDYVLEMADEQTKIIPGHSPLGDKKALEKYRDMLVTVRDSMQKLIVQGSTLEEIVTKKPKADLEKTWGNGFQSPAAFHKILFLAMP